MIFIITLQQGRLSDRLNTITGILLRKIPLVAASEKGRAQTHHFLKVNRGLKGGIVRSFSSLPRSEFILLRG